MLQHTPLAAGHDRDRVRGGVEAQHNETVVRSVAPANLPVARVRGGVDAQHNETVVRR